MRSSSQYSPRPAISLSPPLLHHFPRKQPLRIPHIHLGSLLLTEQLLQPFLHPLREILHKSSPREGVVASVEQPLMTQLEPIHERFQLALSAVRALEYSAC